MAQRPADCSIGRARHFGRSRREGLLRDLRLGRNAESYTPVDLPASFVPLLMRWLKGSTARGANQILGRTGQPFWQGESFDRYLRAASQLQRTMAYIEQNPVSAGLVRSAEHWPWSSAGWQAEPPAPVCPAWAESRWMKGANRSR
jgi:hypothetical protein